MDKCFRLNRLSIICRSLPQEISNRCYSDTQKAGKKKLYLNPRLDQNEHSRMFRSFTGR